MTQPNIDVSICKLTGNLLTDSKILALQACQKFKNKKYSVAKSLFMEALNLRKQCLGESSHYLAELMDNIALCLCAEGKHEEAEKIWSQGIELLTKSFYDNHHSLAPLLDHLGNCLYEQGKFKECDPILNQSMTIHQKTQRLDHPDLLKSILKLTNLYLKLGNPASAEPLIKKAIMQAEKNATAPIGDFYLCQAQVQKDKFDDACLSFKKAIKAYTQQSSYTKLVACLESYARYLKDNNHTEEANMLESQISIMSGKSSN